MHCAVQCNKYSKTLKQFIILDWIKLLWNRLSLWAGLCKCSWNKIIVIQWRQLANMSDLTVLSACWVPISKAAHKYVRPHSVINLLRPDIEDSSQICQTSQCYQPVEFRYRRQLTNMSDLTVLSACWDPISKTAHKYVRPHSVISLLRTDIEGSSQICQTAQCYQSVETRYRRQLTNMSDLTMLSACWDPISKTAHKYVRPHSVISLLRPDIEGSSQICQISQCYQPVETRYRRQLKDMSDLSQCYQPVETRYRRQLTNMSNLSQCYQPVPDIEGSSQICHTSQCYQPVETRYRRQLTNMSDLTMLSACWDPISKATHRYVIPHSVINLLRPDIEGSSQICQISQCYQPVETRYRRQLTDMSYLTVLSSFWDPISKAAHKYVWLHSVICLLRHDIPLVSVYLTLISDLLATINSPYYTCHSRHSRTVISYQLAWCT